MKKRTFAILLLILVSALAMAWLGQSKQVKRFFSFTPPSKFSSPTFNSAYLKKIQSKAKEARSFGSVEGFNTSICFLIDMSLPSGSNRFFVYDLNKDSILKKGLVTHGRCNLDWLEGRKYDNQVGGGCTSLGKYKIGNSYTGRFGLAFKLHGLEKTNNKAFERFVVLHSHSCVPESETIDEICQSDGCPTVSPGFLQELSPLIKQSSKPVLLWIFN
jgi:hypothetical protein